MPRKDSAAESRASMKTLAAALAALVLLGAAQTRAADPPKDPPVFKIGAILAMT